jgi:bisphosphoglycerate-dependent phosphoglycerate mutase
MSHQQKTEWNSNNYILGWSYIIINIMEEKHKQNGILLKKETLKGNAKCHYLHISIHIINIITNIKATPPPNMYR